MDVMSFHLYPDSWGKDPSWGTQWIASHIQYSQRLGDRAILGEFGDLNKALRNPIYFKWEKTVLQDNGAGALYWILSAGVITRITTDTPFIARVRCALRLRILQKPWSSSR